MHAAAEIVVERLLFGDVGQERLLRVGEVFVQAVLEGANVCDLDIVEIALRAGEENHHLLLPA